MNYKLRAINDDSISLNGTHGQGSIITTMRNLTLAFGECEEEEGDKTRYMWFLKFEKFIWRYGKAVTIKEVI